MSKQDHALPDRGRVARLPQRVARAPAQLVALDHAAGRWLVLMPSGIAGDLVILVQSSHSTRALAEHAAGMHEAPPYAWLLLDPALGWRRRSGHGWVDDPAAAGQWPSEVQAREIQAFEPGLQLMVARTHGFITCPDVDPRVAVEDAVAAGGTA